MGEVKTYRIQGLALFSGNRYPEWRKFSLEVRALNKDQAIEYIYSIIGSRHRIKRANIRITSIDEIRPEEARNSFIRELSRIEGWEIVK